MNTKKNLMRAYVSECQARARYEMAAKVAKKQKLYVLADMFCFTAKQEKHHAIIFYDHLKNIFKEENISIEANYPVNIQNDIAYLLNQAMEHEKEESTSIYHQFSEEARKEGYLEVAASFEMISEIEDFHYHRFKKFHDLYTKGSLFQGAPGQVWMCLHCGFIYDGPKAPEVCPACHHPQGYYIRVEQAPYYQD
ncbi:rubrerythrin family protein [Tannockella kyphosi]|uniref:rubrerythrin family protein n=1 Tax=Tannockella kyphosi TaxID=2899121 RepID=UPI002012CCE4|nr:ferritin family protein [Tannockella kyphosi]